MRFPVLLIALVSGLVLAPAALASRAAVGPDGVLAVTARTGERNDVSVREGLAPAWEVTDTAGLQAGAGCVSTGPTTAICAPLDPAALSRPPVRVDLKDRDDHGLAYDNGGGPLVVLLGGPGDDELTNAATGTAQVLGGPGDDVLLAATHGGHALLDGGGGADRLTLADFASSATLTGGAGDDELVRVPTGSGPMGPESLDGGGGDDTLSGTYNPETLTGGPGRDRLNGGGGGDTLDCGAGRDAFALYAGDLATRCESPFAPGP